MSHKFYSNPVEKVVLAADGPKPQELYSEGELKVIAAGLEAGQKIPVHPEGLSVFHFVEGRGTMIVDGERLPVAPGTVIIATYGTPRGMEAETKLKFVAVRVNEFKQ